MEQPQLLLAHVLRSHHGTRLPAPRSALHSPPRPCSRIEQLRLLSKLEQSGLLSVLEKQGVTLSKLEQSG